MADDSLIEETGNQSLNSNTVEDGASGITVVESVNEDILQQAFAGHEDFDQEAVTYSVEATEDVSRSGTHEIDSTVVAESGLNSATQIVAGNSGFGTTTYRVVSSLPDGSVTLADDLINQAVSSDAPEHSIVETASGEVSLIDHEGQQVLEGQQILLPVADGQQVMSEAIETDHSIQQVEDRNEEEQPQQVRQTFRLTLMDTSNQSGAPLGSSQNPIRIIQQGNNYTPMQQLSSDQLQQIMQVVQQQQVAKNTQESGGSVLFNPSTNTRIVYRVIYPSELHKGQQTVLHVTPKGTTTSSIPLQQTAPIPKRQYRKRGKDDEEDKMDGPEMSKEEKEERKKHRPRTRSGRVSRPPKHMVKDYKHIHVLDWDEDYDDSDGGYSDYKGSDEERSKEKEKQKVPDLYPGLSLSAARPRNYKCQTCEKCYIGQARLLRHYRLNPSHGSIPDDGVEDGETMNDVLESTESTPILMNNGSTTITSTSVTVPVIAGSVGSSTGNLSEDSNTQDSIPSSSGAISPITTRTPRRGRGGFRGRGRWAFHHSTAPARRKQKLKEVVKTAEDDDLMEVVLPRLVKFVSLWEFMLMKVETCNGAHPRVDHIYKEFLALHKHVKQICQEGLQLKTDTGQHNGLDGEESRDGNLDVLKLEDDAIAKSLGLQSGSYGIKDLPVNEYTSFRYKYLTSDPNGPAGVAAEKRVIQVVTPDELVSQSPAKRSKTTSLLHSVSGAPAAVTLAPSAAAASSLLTSIVTNSGLKGSGSKQPSLFRTVAIQQPQTSLLQTVRVQQPQNNLLQNVAVEQTPAMLSSMTLQAQPQATTVLRTVSMPVQNQPSPVLRTVTVQSQAQPTQTNLLRSVQQPLVVNANVQQPVVVNASRHSNGAGLVGVSLLNNHRSAGANQPASIAVLKPASGQTSHVLMAASASPTVTGSGLCEIPQSQAAHVVSVLPTSMQTTHLSLLNQTPGSIASDFSAMTPDDFMDTSDDSLVSSVSGLSSANSSGLVSVHSSHPNGEMTEVGLSSFVKVNGVSDPTKPDSVLGGKDQPSLLNDPVPVTAVTTMQENTDQLTVPLESAPHSTSLLMKCENGELYTVASSGETVPLTSCSAETVLALAEDMTATTANGQLCNTEMEELQEKGETTGNEVNCELLDQSESAVQEGLLTNRDVKMELEDSGEVASFTLHQDATLFQTEDGTVILQNPDGTTFQLQGVGEQGLTLESVQELLGQMVTGGQVQTEVQQ